VAIALNVTVFRQEVDGIHFAVRRSGSEFMADQRRITATEAGRRLRDGRLTAATLMAGYLDRIAEGETMVHAFAFLDPAAAMQAAEQADRRSPTGVLHGLPIGVKDVLDAAGVPTAYGSPIWPRADAAAVALARAAGALILGKTATTEFAGSHPGPTTNPANPAHTPGGSSSGSAAAVADGFCPLAFGTQTAGSVYSACSVLRRRRLQTELRYDPPSRNEGDE
jgi:amidase